MSLETEVAALTTATTDLLGAVNTSKATLDQAVSDAEAQVALAQGKVDLAAAQVALAEDQVDLAAAQVALAEGYAATANTQAGNAQTSAQTAQTAANNAVAVVTGGTASLTPSAGKIPIADATGQIDSGWVNPLPAVAATLHRSPTPITALFVYDTSKDSDGGAWTEKCQHTTWYNETLSGKWLGAQASESAARAVSGAVTGDYFQLTSDGRFYSLNAGSGTTAVFRGNKRSFPKLAALVLEGTSGVDRPKALTIYDLTEPGRPMWKRVESVGYAGLMANANHLHYQFWTTSVVALNGRFCIGMRSNAGNSTGLTLLDFPLDRAWRYNRSNAIVEGIYGLYDLGLGNSQTGKYRITVGFTWPDFGPEVDALAITVMPDAPDDPVTGLKVPTIAGARTSGLCVIHNTGEIRLSQSTSAFTQVTLAPQFLSAGRADAVWYYAANPNALSTSFSLSTKNASTATDFNVGNTALLKAKDRANLARTSGADVQLLRNNEGAIGKGIAAKLSDTYNTGWLSGDIRRAYLANSKTADRSYKSATATETGTVTSAAVNTSADLVAYSGFSAANYIQEPYHADLDFGTGEWSASSWVSIPTNNVAAGTIACREHSSGAYIRLGIDATNKLTATVYDGTTTRTVTTASAYNTATWIKVRANYTTDGRLVLLVNGLQVAATTGDPLLTLNNGNAVLTIGNSYALDAPFPGSVCLLKFSASVPTAEQSLFMYEQEKHLFSAGAKCVLPASTGVLDLAYDDATDTWSTLQATHEATFSGLIRTATQTPSAGSFSRTAETSGVQLLGRTTTNPGVDVRMPAKNLRPKDMPRDINQDIVVFDYLGGFTAATTLNSTSLTSVASSLVPASANLIGCSISGTGIPANTVITGVSGTTIFMSKAATANGSSIQISTTDFNLPVGYEAKAVMVAGVLQQEGSTKSWTRLFDGFRETVRFGASPGYNAWVQLQAVKSNA